VKDIDETPLTFGKYKGISPNKISEYDPKYLVWAYENTSQIVCSKELYEACYEACYEDLIDYESEKMDDLHFGFDGY